MGPQKGERLIISACRVASESLRDAVRGCSGRTRYGVIRHPCDRLLSAWSGVVVPALSPCVVMYHGMAFEEFVEVVCEEVSEGSWTQYWAPQWGVLAGKYDVLIHYEQLGELWGDLSRRYGWGGLTTANRSFHPDWRIIFSPRMIEMTYWAYREDFAIGGWRP